MGTAQHPPQVIVGARGFYAVWLPADPDAVAKLVPEGLTPADGCPVFMNQYRVDDSAQTSSHGSRGRVRQLLAHLPRGRPGRA